jgi:DNA polymerase III epsilon subunit-like protein
MAQTKAVVSKFRRLFADIETSPNVVLSWRCGYDINIAHDNIIKERKIICIGYKFEGDKKVQILRWDKDQDDRKMLEAFLEVAKEADEIVGHYLDRFDLPWIRARCLILGLDPLPLLKTVDTKAWASKYFYFNSNKLDYLGEVLGFGKKIKTDFDLWKDIVLHKSQKALGKMCTYCARDIDLLEKVFLKLQGCTKPKTHVGVLNGGEKWSCPFTGSTDVQHEKLRVTSTGTRQHQFFSRTAKKYYQVSDTAFKEYMAYRLHQLKEMS